MGQTSDHGEEPIDREIGTGTESRRVSSPCALCHARLDGCVESVAGRQPLAWNCKTHTKTCDPADGARLTARLVASQFFWADPAFSAMGSAELRITMV